MVSPSSLYISWDFGTVLGIKEHWEMLGWLRHHSHRNKAAVAAAGSRWQSTAASSALSPAAHGVCAGDLLCMWSLPWLFTEHFWDNDSSMCLLQSFWGTQRYIWTATQNKANMFEFHWGCYIFSNICKISKYLIKKYSYAPLKGHVATTKIIFFWPGIHTLRFWPITKLIFALHLAA